MLVPSRSLVGLLWLCLVQRLWRAVAFQQFISEFESETDGGSLTRMLPLTLEIVT